MSFVPYDRPVRAAFIGLGRIYDLNVGGYLDNPDVEVVALVDPSEERRAQRRVVRFRPEAPGGHMRHPQVKVEERVGELVVRTALPAV